MSFSFRKAPIGTNKPSDPFKLPMGNPSDISIQPKGCMIYSPVDNFVYISDGANWDRVSGVNNPIDLLLPVTQHRMPKWSEDYPPGGAYTAPVLQDSSLEVDDDGNATLYDTGNTPSSFPWTNANLMVHGSIVSSYTFGNSLDATDPTIFTPVLTQIQGIPPSSNVPTSNVPISNIRSLEIHTREGYDGGSIAIGHSAMNDIVSSGIDSKSSRNVAVGVSAGKHFSTSATDNVCIGWSAWSGLPSAPVTGSGNIFIGSDSSSRGGTSGYANTGSIAIGAFSSARADDNIVIGYKSNDNGYNNIVSLGSNAVATGNNRLVLGSGIQVLEIPSHKIENLPTQTYITIQIGKETYLLPLSKMI